MLAQVSRQGGGDGGPFVHAATRAVGLHAVEVGDRGRRLGVAPGSVSAGRIRGHREVRAARALPGHAQT